MTEREKLQELVCGACQILDVVKEEWDEAWSEWDQSIRDGLSDFLAGTPEFAIPETTPPQDTGELHDECVSGNECLQRGCPKCEGVRLTKANVAGYEKGFKAAQQYIPETAGIIPQLVSSNHQVDGVDVGESLDRVRYQRDGESLITANVGAWYATAVYWRYRAEKALAKPAQGSEPNDL